MARCVTWDDNPSEGGEADWAQPPLLKILAVDRLIVIVAANATCLVLEDAGLAFACGEHVGPETGTVGVADAGEEVDATPLIPLVEHGFGDIWEEQVLLLDDVIEEPPAVLDLLDIVLVKGELSRLGCGGSCISSSSSSSFSLGWG